MPKPDRPPERPDVIDLNARRRAAEVQKQALAAAKKHAPRRQRDVSPLTAWALLLGAAVVWTAVSVLT